MLENAKIHINKANILAGCTDIDISYETKDLLTTGIMTFLEDYKKIFPKHYKCSQDLDIMESLISLSRENELYIEKEIIDQFGYMEYQFLLKKKEHNQEMNKILEYGTALHLKIKTEQYKIRLKGKRRARQRVQSELDEIKRKHKLEIEIAEEKARQRKWEKEEIAMNKAREEEKERQRKLEWERKIREKEEKGEVETKEPTIDYSKIKNIIYHVVIYESSEEEYQKLIKYEGYENAPRAITEPASYKHFTKYETRLTKEQALEILVGEKLILDPEEEFVNELMDKALFEEQEYSIVKIEIIR